MKMPLHSVRGRIRAYIERYSHLLGYDVLEIGSRQHQENAWWLNNRDLAQGAWLGCDMQEGLNVDVVADIHNPPAEWRGRFTGVLCSEVLEHVARPWLALPKVREVMRPNSWMIVTTLTSFPIHGYPDDFYRYTASGLTVLLEDAGFRNIQVENDGELDIRLNDHGESGWSARKLPIHVFGVAQC